MYLIKERKDDILCSLSLKLCKMLKVQQTAEETTQDFQSSGKKVESEVQQLFYSRQQDSLLMLLKGRMCGRNGDGQKVWLKCCSCQAKSRVQQSFQLRQQDKASMLLKGEGRTCRRKEIAEGRM